MRPLLWLAVGAAAEYSCDVSPEALEAIVSRASAALGGAPAAEPALLAAALYLWQFPHFFALAYYNRKDYARGGFAMVPVRDPTGARTAALVWRYSLALAPLPFAACAAGVTSPMFLVEASALNGALVALAAAFRRAPSDGAARKVFLLSLAYLPAWLFFFLFHLRPLHERERDAREQPLTTKLALWCDEARAAGRALCAHEVLVEKQHQSSAKAQPPSAASSAAATLCPKIAVDGAADAAKEAAAVTVSAAAEASASSAAAAARTA